MLNNSIVNFTSIHKHLGMIFDSKLSFNKQLRSVLKKVKLLVYYENSKVSFLKHP